jgi:hypothetical protein
MTWDCRVIAKKDKTTGEIWHAVHEVFYDENGKIWGATVGPITPMGETVDDLITELAEHLVACGKPVLDFEAIPEPGAINLADAALKELGIES